MSGNWVITLIGVVFAGGYFYDKTKPKRANHPALLDMQFEKDGSIFYQGWVKEPNSVKHGEGEETGNIEDINFNSRGLYKDGDFTSGERRITVKNNDQVIERGEFDDNNLVKGEYKTKKLIVEGSFDQNGKLHGRDCVITNRDLGTKVRADFDHDQMIGNLEITYSDGSRFRCTSIQPGQQLQKGTLHLPNGQTHNKILKI
ncbi:hypothetical protein AKO1_001842 [Acrasis kona]|uniref:MORN repeat protein n=1 Tax=Acrasis kona TaxID=1008807 RepID=A0AAW2Z8K7_9EUKA